MVGVVCRCGGVRTDGKCDRCQGGKGWHEQSSYRRGYDRRWQQLSSRYRTLHPLCEQCESEGRVTAATEVHHVVPIKVDRTKRLEEANLMAVCRACHEKLETGV